MFISVAFTMSDNNPRNTSVHKLRMTFDYGVGLTFIVDTIAVAVLHVYFHADYRLYYIAAKPTVSIHEYTSDATTKL